MDIAQIINNKMRVSIVGGQTSKTGGQTLAEALTDQTPIIPDETEDYIQIPFRMLSKTLITDYWIDFTKEDVLKKALEKFQTKLYTDHRTDVRNSIGTSLNPRWTNSHGIEGIDADYKIYKTLAPEIIARLKTEPPIIDSTSVGISFEFEKSHKMKSYEFYNSLGREVDGQIVRMIVTEITEIHEASLVSKGANRTAKMIFTIGQTSQSQTEGDLTLGRPQAKPKIKQRKTT